jgi:hypothetical protein
VKQPRSAIARSNAAARAAAARKHHGRKKTAAQRKAILKWTAAGRAAKKARHHGHVRTPRPRRALGGQPGGPLAQLAGANQAEPACAATALAVHLHVTRRVTASTEDILALHRAAGGTGDGAHISDLLETAASAGLGGIRIARFWPVTTALPGTVAGLALPGGSHAVLTLPGGMCITWGQIRPCGGEIEEAWWIEWD